MPLWRRAARPGTSAALVNAHYSNAARSCSDYLPRRPGTRGQYVGGGAAAATLGHRYTHADVAV